MVRYVWRNAVASALAALAALVCLAGLAGCAAVSKLPADQAFALSASALAGSDRYSYTGEYAVTGTDESAASSGRFSGEVVGHRSTVLRWEGAPKSGKVGGSHPLSLVESVQLQAAAIAYEALDGDTVALKVALRPEAAQARAADLLRSRQETSDALDLDSLKATTVCVWTADRRSWFPTQLKEESVLQYRMNGRWRTEKRTSVTNFRRRADNAIINQEERL